MFKVINSKRYNQLAIELLRKIFNGYYEPGAKLPSTRELAKQASSGFRNSRSKGNRLQEFWFSEFKEIDYESFII